jgi:hypothetical protein
MKRALGAHRFQPAGVAGYALKSDWATRRDCTLETMRAQALANHCKLIIAFEETGLIVYQFSNV